MLVDKVWHMALWWLEIGVYYHFCEHAEEEEEEEEE